MFGILISGMIFIFCLLIAFISQTIRSSKIQSNINSFNINKKNFQEPIKQKNSDSNLEIDPNDLNPTLFIMASNSTENNRPLVNKTEKLNNDNINNLGNGIVKSTLKSNNESIYFNEESKALIEEKTTVSGLKIRDLIIGVGSEAIPGRKVTVNYSGKLENGTEFDKRYIHTPFTFSLGSRQVIQGWDEGVTGMKVGGKRMLVIPSKLGYGPRGAGLSIPPNATLVYEIKLLNVNN